MADLCLIPQLYNARRFGVDLDRYPRLVKVEAQLQGHPAFTAAHPNTNRRSKTFFCVGLSTVSCIKQHKA